MRFLLCVLCVVCGSRALAQEPAEHYYMMIFSAQDGSSRPQLCHSFATFVKVTGTENSPAYRIEPHTISWMPRSLHIAVLRARPEPGVNLDLWSTLRWAESNHCHVSMWGPYEIDQELYARALEQKARLQSGYLLYKTVDSRFRPGGASNCIHAVADLDTDNGLMRFGSSGRGDAAGQLLVQHLQHWVIDPRRTHFWLAIQLGL